MKKSMSFFTQLTKFDVILRLFFGPFIFISPIFSTLVIFILDGFDGEIIKRSGYARHQYSTYDKIMDYWWYIWIFIFVLYTNVPVKNLFIFLFLYRTVGQLLYLLYQKGIIFFLFPNVFESLFYYYLVAHIVHQEQFFFAQPLLTYVIIALTILKLAQEYIIHIRLMNLSGTYLKKTSYWPKVTVNPYKAFVFLSIALALGITFNQFILNKPTDTYVAKATKAKINGTVLTYNPSGTITGVIYRQTTKPIQITLFSLPMTKPRCDSTLTTLKSTTQDDNGIKKPTALFTYTNPCLTSLPDGLYKILIMESGQKDLGIEFRIEHSVLKK
ncbi:MAG: hypothetical protein WAV51_01205 [Microgenomates group bacterium]